MTKFCKDCKHFSIGPIQQFFYNIEFGKCMKYPYPLTAGQRTAFFISGKLPESVQHFYASTARIHHTMCGPTGADFVKR
jgi:hypothetical protein